MRNDERIGVGKMPRKSLLQIGQLSLADQLLCDDALAEVLCKIQQKAATAVAWWIDVNDGVDPDLDEAGLAK